MRRRKPEPLRLQAKKFIPLLAFVVLAGLLFRGLSIDPTDLPAARLGQPFPQFSQPELSTGSDISVEALADRPALVNVWATWCTPCLQEMPSMQRMYDALEGEDFEILAVSIDAPFGENDAFGRPGGDLDLFVKELGLTFPILHNPDGEIQRDYQTTGVPESFIVGKDGVIYKKVAGPTEWDASVNEELVRRLLSSQ